MGASGMGRSHHRDRKLAPQRLGLRWSEHPSTPHPPQGEMDVEVNAANSGEKTSSGSSTKTGIFLATMKAWGGGSELPRGVIPVEISHCAQLLLNPSFPLKPDFPFNGK